MSWEKGETIILWSWSGSSCFRTERKNILWPKGSQLLKSLKRVLDLKNPVFGIYIISSTVPFYDSFMVFPIKAGLSRDIFDSNVTCSASRYDIRPTTISKGWELTNHLMNRLYQGSYVESSPTATSSLLSAMESLKKAIAQIMCLKSYL